MEYFWYGRFRNVGAHPGAYRLGDDGESVHHDPGHGVCLGLADQPAGGDFWRTGESHECRQAHGICQHTGDGGGHIWCHPWSVDAGHGGWAVLAVPDLPGFTHIDEKSTGKITA